MLSLKITDQAVDIPDDFSITMNLKSPVFGEVGSYSYPFKIPNTPKNAILMGFRHRPENTGDVYGEGQGMFLWNGINIFQGTVKLKTFNSKYFEGSMFEGGGDFYYARKNLTLQDIDFGEMVFATEYERLLWINHCKGHVYPEREISFPMIENATYFNEAPAEPQLNYFNYYDVGQMYQITPELERTVIVPMLFLRYVLDKIFEHIGFVFDDSFFGANADFNSLVLFNLVDCNGRADGFFTYDLLHLFLNYHVPRMSINDFFLGLETFFNIRFFVNNSTRKIKLKSVDIIVKETGHTEFSKQIVSINTEAEEQVTGFSLKMSMDTDDPSWTEQKGFDDAFLKCVKPPVQSISDLPAWPSSKSMDIRFVKDEGMFYILWYFNWIAHPLQSNIISSNAEVVYKVPDQSLESSFSTLMNATSGPDTGNCVVGNARENWEGVSPKLFFTVYDPTSSNIRMVGKNSIGSTNLFYNGTNGLFYKHYKAYFDFLMGAKFVKVTKQMTFMELKEFDFSRKYMINGIKYLVKSIQVTLKKDRIMPALLECYTCQ